MLLSSLSSLSLPANGSLRIDVHCPQVFHLLSTDLQSSLFHCSSPFLNILTLQELKCYFKYNQGILPKYLQNWNFIPNSKIHNHNTRKITTLHTFKTKHEFAKKTLKYNLPCTINNTPHIVKDKVNTHSFQGFSLYVKQYLIRKYNTNCISRNCYICEQNA